MNKMYILVQTDSEDGALDVRVFLNINDARKALKQVYNEVLEDEGSNVEYNEIDKVGNRAYITLFNGDTFYLDVFEAPLEINVKENK